MPTAFIVSLRATEDLPSSFVHRKLHGLACGLFEGGGPADEARATMAGAHVAQTKPFAVWPLLRNLEHEDDAPLQWRLNWLRDSGDNGPVTPRLPRQLRLGTATLRCLDVHVGPRPFGELARLGPVWRYDLTFLAPTYFSRSGRDYLLPDPELLIGRLTQRWNQSVGNESLQIDESTAKALRAEVILVAHDITTMRAGDHRATTIVHGEPLVVDYEIASTRRRRDPDPAERAGFVGVTRIGLRSRRDPALGQAFARLCAFAEYCGIGAETTHGLGAVIARPVHG